MTEEQEMNCKILARKTSKDRKRKAEIEDWEVEGENVNSTSLVSCVEAKRWQVERTRGLVPCGISKRRFVPARHIVAHCAEAYES